jgi:hypothetical protein
VLNTAKQRLRPTAVRTSLVDCRNLPLRWPNASLDGRFCCVAAVGYSFARPPLSLRSGSLTSSLNSSLAENLGDVVEKEHVNSKTNSTATYCCRGQREKAESSLIYRHVNGCKVYPPNNLRFPQLGIYLFFRRVRYSVCNPKGTLLCSLYRRVVVRKRSGPESSV